MPTPQSSRFSQFLRPDETIVWIGRGGGSEDVRVIFSFLVLGAIGVPILAFAHFAVSPLTGLNTTFVLMGCLAAGRLASALIRGPDNSKRDYVLTNQRILVGNFDPADATAMAVIHEADQASIQRLTVSSRSDYSAIRVETNRRAGANRFLLLDQENPAEVADLIRTTLAVV